MNAVIEARRVRRVYGGGAAAVVALADIDLTLHAGEIVALVGPSGSGKTTLLNVLCGWEAPDSGEVTWAPDPGRALDRLPWSAVSVVPQGLGLLEDLTIAENVSLPARLDASGDAERVGALLEQLGIAHLAGRLPAATSLGEQQRAAVARALALRPALALADEPTAHQDAHHAARTLQALTDAARQGAACLVATHSDAVTAAADRVLHLRDGRLHETSGA